MARWSEAEPSGAMAVMPPNPMPSVPTQTQPSPSTASESNRCPSGASNSSVPPWAAGLAGSRATWPGPVTSHAHTRPLWVSAT